MWDAAKVFNYVNISMLQSQRLPRIAKTKPALFNEAFLKFGRANEPKLTLSSLKSVNKTSGL